MKRYLLQWVFGLGVALATAGPAQAILIGFDPTPQTVTIGSSVDVGVVISGLGAGDSPSLSAFDLNISFNPARLSFVNVLFGDQLDIFGFGLNPTFAGIISSGVLNLFEVSLDESQDLDDFQASSFTLATIRFDTIGIGASALGIAINAMGDALGDPLKADVSSGSIVVERSTAVPEPGTLGLLALGCAGLICLGRKRGYY